MDSNDENSRTCQIASEDGGCKGSGTRLRVLDADWQKKREGEMKVQQCKEMCNVEGLVASQRLALFTVRCLLTVDARPLMFFWLLGTYFFWISPRSGRLAQRRRPQVNPRHSASQTGALLGRVLNGENHKGVSFVALLLISIFCSLHLSCDLKSTEFVA